MSVKGPALIELKNRIVEKFSSSNWKELAALTDTEREIVDHDRLLRSLRFGDEDYEGVVLTVLKSVFKADRQNLKIVLDYVDQKFGPVGENVSSTKVIGRSIVFTPAVFKVPDVQVDESLVSVMMPFDSSFAGVYKSIARASKAKGYRCLRADDIWNDSTLIQDIFALIFESRVVVCDFTGKNPNVFYEAGIAHTLGKHVIPIAQHKSDIPFDLQHHRYLKYLNNAEGLSELERKLAIRLESLAVAE